MAFPPSLYLNPSLSVSPPPSFPFHHPFFLTLQSRLEARTLVSSRFMRSPVCMSPMSRVSIGKNTSLKQECQSCPLRLCRSCDNRARCRYVIEVCLTERRLSQHRRAIPEDEDRRVVVRQLATSSTFVDPTKWKTYGRVHNIGGGGGGGGGLVYLSLQSHYEVSRMVVSSIAVYLT